MCKFVSWNLNSLRARFLHLEALILKESPDIIMLQEVRADIEKLDILAIESLGYNVVHNLFKGRNGVMILSKYRIEDFSITFSNKNLKKHIDKFKISDCNEGRYIECYVVIKNKTFCICSIYFPNGHNSVNDDKQNLQTEDSERFNYKLAFYEDVAEHSRSLHQKADYVVLGGDYNVARHKRDVHNPDLFYNVPCFHPLEHQRFELLLDCGYVDYFREKNPTITEYTWWDYRMLSYKQNKGLRIDYIITSKNLLELIYSYKHLKYYRELDKPSDHCPVLLEIR